MVQGQVFLKEGLALSLFQGLSFLHFEISLPLQNCAMHL